MLSKDLRFRLPFLFFRLPIHVDVNAARYRITHRVTMEEHNALLKGRGWTEEEFEAGFRQGVAPRQGSEHFIQYEALVRRELAKGEVRQRGERPRDDVTQGVVTYVCRSSGGRGTRRRHD